MPVSKDQFDQDLAAAVAAVNDYIAAVDAFINLPPIIDLSQEDDTVKAALDAVNAAKGRIPQPPPP